MPTFITPHFTLEEATYSDTAVRRDIPNKPTPAVWANMQAAALHLEKVRDITGPLHVNSWYRQPLVNQLVGGAKDSAHMTGFAIDCTSTDYTPYELCKMVIDSGIKFDQIILEFNRWMHISFDPKMRQQVLSIFKPGMYQNGLIKP